MVLPMTALVVFHVPERTRAFLSHTPLQLMAALGKRSYWGVLNGSIVIHPCSGKGGVLGIVQPPAWSTTSGTCRFTQGGQGFSILSDLPHQLRVLWVPIYPDE